MASKVWLLVLVSFDFHKLQRLLVNGKMSNTIRKSGYLDEKGMANKPGITLLDMFAKVTRLEMEINTLDIYITLQWSSIREVKYKRCTQCVKI